MRILHTSDWHIGKRLEGKLRLDEQALVIDEIISICEENSVQVVIISGDIYDTFLPQAEAEALFFEKIKKLSSDKRIVIVACGNHDDQTRLCACAPLSVLSNVYFADNTSRVINGEETTLKVKMNDAGEGYFIVQEQGQSVFFGVLSYPTELRLKEKIDDSEDYTHKVKRWIDNIFEKNTQNLPQIFVSHLFMLGGERSESERDIELGGARILEKSVIPKNCIYSALGHLHKRQIIDNDRNILYSGSILQYSFDESGQEKSVTMFDVSDGKVENLSVKKLSQGKKLFKVKASSLEEGERLVKELDGFVELSLELDAPLLSLEHKEFSKKFPDCFLKLNFSNISEEFKYERRTLDDKQLFVEYYKRKYGCEPDEKIVSLFLNYLNQAENDDETY